LGKLVTSAVDIVEKGFMVARDPTANIEIGTEPKIIDHVVGDLQRQVDMFVKQGAILFWSVSSVSIVLTVTII